MSGGDSGKKLGGLLKKAVSIGAEVYTTAENQVQKTMGVVSIPKDMLKESLESLFESYTLTLNAEIQLTPKKKQGTKKNTRAETEFDSESLEGEHDEKTNPKR